MDTEIAKAAKAYQERNSICVELPPVASIKASQHSDVFPCKIYRMIATLEICAKCRTDPLFKQSLYARYLDGQAVRRDIPCRHQGPAIGKRVVGCCGGGKQTEIAMYVCALLSNKVAEPDCWLCGDYKP